MNNDKEIERIKNWIKESELGLEKLIEKSFENERYILRQKQHISNYKEILGHLGICECRYSKAMYQEYPRLCIYCNKPEPQNKSI